MIVNIVPTIDVVQDGLGIDNERNTLTWKALENLPDIKQFFDSFQARVTWFVRADNQLKDVYGTSAYVLDAHANLWQDFLSSGDEIGWHPHIYKRDGRDGQYVLDRDVVRCVQQMRSTWSDLQREGHVFSSLRMGECFHVNETMKAAADLGLLVDSTAIPGRKRQDSARVFDWETTLAEPYFPSHDDYRISGSVGALPILEVPLTTIEVQTSYDRQPLKRYLNLTFHHALFRGGVDGYLRSTCSRRKDSAVIVTVFLPDEINRNETNHPLHAFSITEARRNLDYMLKAIESFGCGYRFLRVQDVLEKYVPITEHYS
jgi:hypothetical protein